VIKQKYLAKMHHLEAPKPFIPNLEAPKPFIPNQFLQSYFESPPPTLRVAITIHLYYLDMSYYFVELLQKVTLNYDLKITISDAQSKSFIQDLFTRLEYAKDVDVRIVPNRGRNFAPLLVEFGNELADRYDVFLHLHSKKSLYTGKEQQGWFEFLTNNLIFDSIRTNEILNILNSSKNIGIIYPAGYSPFSAWVYSWLGNSESANHIDAKLGLNTDNSTHAGFCDYPVGGMFWARTDALKEILEANWQYEDFPLEQGQNDSTLHHAVERYLSVSTIKNGYCAGYTFNGLLSSDPSFSWKNRDLISNSILEIKLSVQKTLSWDLFDTLIYRVNGQPDLGKYKVGEVLHEAGVLDAPWDYVEIRTEVEKEIRSSLALFQDVSLESITNIIVSSRLQDSPFTSHELADLEFQFDLQEMRPRPGIVDVYNNLSDKSFLISDTYYSQGQVETILECMGINYPLNSYISANTGLRKDNGDVWRELLSQKIIIPELHIHLGDNEFSDNQLPSDYGIRTILIPSAIRIWSYQFYKVHRKYLQYPTLNEFLLSAETRDYCATIQRYFSCPLSVLTNSD
jgi:FMN phosphatase YigB (HAD superfamily)